MKGFIRREEGGATAYTEIHFYPDTSLEEGMRVISLLNQINTQKEDQT